MNDKKAEERESVDPFAKERASESQDNIDTVSDTEVEETTEEAMPDQEAPWQEELAAAKDKYLRLFAEFENFRRRTAKERLELTTAANERLISDLLPVIDDFERSMKIFQDNPEVTPMYEGIKLVHNKFMKILEQKGLKPMDIQQGDSFDAEYHEAVVQTPAPEEKLKGKVIDVIEQGYFLGEKVLRYAKVVTGS